MQNAEQRQFSPIRFAFCIPHFAFVTSLLTLIVVTLMVFSPTIDHKFVAWDDQAEIYYNPDFNPVTWQHLCNNITHTSNGLTVWMPLTYFVWGGIAAIAHQPADKDGITLDPAYFHAACIVFHLCATVLCFLVLRRLIGQDWPAACGAALFALHPLQVEPVAWASGMYTVLSGAFCLAAILTYLNSIDAEKGSRRWVWFTVSTILFVAAMLTKPSALVLPIIVAVIHLAFSPSPLAGEGRGEEEDVPLRAELSAGERLTPHPNPLSQGERGQERTVLITMLLIWLPLAVADFVIAKKFQPAENIAALPIGQRLLVAGDAMTFYLGKLLAPIHLIPDYGLWPQKVLAMPATRWLALLAIVPIIIAAIFIRRMPRLTLAILIFFIGLAPFLGLVRFDFQFYSTVADRYAYLAMLGPAILLGAILARWPGSPLYAAAGLCLFALAFQSVNQVQRWQDTRTLFTYTWKIRPDSVAANRILATEDFYSDPPSAERHFQEALAVRPDDPTTHYNYGLLLGRLHKLPEAIAQFQATIALNPQHAKALDELGVALMRQRKFDEARIYFDRSIQAAAAEHLTFPAPSEHLETLKVLQAHFPSQ